LSKKLLSVIFCLCSFLHANGQVGFPYCETFTENNTQSATVFGADASLTGDVLRLTTNQMNQRGYVYVDIPFSSVFGIKASFEYFSYGGDGADGLTFFLFDADVPNFAIGGFGGSLGYARRDQESGLAGAYLGVGFDEFGNFGNVAESRTGGFPGVGTDLVPDAIVIRGPGNGFDGYEFIKGKKTMEAGADGLPADQQFPISSGGVGTNRVTDPNQVGYRQVEINLEPNPNGIGYLITLVMQYTVEANNPRLLTIFEREPYPYEAPPNLKVGFSGSTGGFTNFHEIRNLIVEVSNDDGLVNPSGVDFDDIASCEGQENTYFITDEEVVLPNPNSVIRCLQFYQSLTDIEEESEDICAQGRCREENRELILPQGTFRAGTDGGDFTFFPNEGFTDQEVEVFYTITDSYGKTSEGNSMTLMIQESPEPVSLLVDGEENVENVRLCEGEKVALEAVGQEEYERYEWYRDEVLLEENTGSSFTVDQAGEYYVQVFNRKNCPSESMKVTVEFPEFPELMLNTPVVGCTPNEPVDSRTGLLTYDTETFDYLLSFQGQSWLNDEMGEINQSGLFDLQLKYKELDCYSEPVILEINILESELLANFEFEVQGTGITGDEDGGIFPDDVIQFTDLSDERAVQWEWDFGDGNTSTDQNPTHVYGEKGEFEIELVITDELGCQQVFADRLAITRSFRVMFPNGFTPLEDDNQYFIPKWKGLESIELLIFNIWGELLFRTEDINSLGWDGKLEGEVLDAGIYVYRFNGVAIDGDEVVESGKFKLIR